MANVNGLPPNWPTGTGLSQACLLKKQLIDRHMPQWSAKMRSAKLKRNTSETKIEAAVNLDGSGKFDIKTGIGFLDHMLAQLAKHARIDLTVRAKGDLHIDQHHTTEDCGIVLGQVVRAALGDKRGIRRYGHAYIVMDEAMSRVALDISGRPYLVWRVEFSQTKVGDMDTELFQEWFRAFAQNAGFTLHVEAIYGDNNHHIVEACYKALAKALREAVAIDGSFADDIPSTKGTLSG